MRTLLALCLSFGLTCGLLVGNAARAADAAMCPQLDGKRVKVTGIVRNLMANVQQEPEASPSTYFVLEKPRWQCKLKRVYVDFPGRGFWCGEGARVEVSGIYHEGREVFTGYNSIDAAEVRCL